MKKWNRQHSRHLPESAVLGPRDWAERVHEF